MEGMYEERQGQMKFKMQRFFFNFFYSLVGPLSAGVNKSKSKIIYICPLINVIGIKIAGSHSSVRRFLMIDRYYD